MSRGGRWRGSACGVHETYVPKGEGEEKTHLPPVRDEQLPEQRPPLLHLRRGELEPRTITMQPDLRKGTSYSATKSQKQNKKPTLCANFVASPKIAHVLSMLFSPDLSPI